MSTNGSRFSGQCEDSPNKHSKSQHKPVDSKDLYGRSMHPEAADLWDGSAVWRWMPPCGIWDRWGWECSQSQQGCQGAQRHMRALWSGHWSITEAINNSSWKNIIWGKKNQESYEWYTGPLPSTLSICRSMDGKSVSAQAKPLSPLSSICRSSTDIFFLTLQQQFSLALWTSFHCSTPQKEKSFFPEWPTLGSDMILTQHPADKRVGSEPDFICPAWSHSSLLCPALTPPSQLRPFAASHVCEATNNDTEQTCKVLSQSPMRHLMLQACECWVSELMLA